MSRSAKLKFSTVSSSDIKLSDDRLSACRKCFNEGSLHCFLFSDQCLAAGDDFQIQIIHMISSLSESLQFGVVSENPINLNRFTSDKEKSLKNSLSLRHNVLYHQNDENVITSEEYDLNLSELREGDLIGIKVTEAGELFFTCNGVCYRKAADNIPKDIWAFVNLSGRCSLISIIPLNSSITKSHKEKWLCKRPDTTEYFLSNVEGNIYFHNYCGKEVVLTDNNCVAKRKNPTNEFRNAVVISNSPLVTDETFRLRIEGLINKWNGSIELGVTFHNPDMFELPTAMNNLRSGTLVLSGNSILTNGHGTRLPYCTTSLDDLKIGDEIGIVRKSNGNVHFFINNDDMGIAGNIPIEKDVWVIADLYGRTIKVSIANNRLKPLTEISQPDTDHIIDLDEDGLVFHSISGKNVRLSEDRLRACRINDQEFNNGVVFTHRPLKVGERWTVKLVRCVEQWAGNMEVGLTTKCPSECDIPSTMTDLITGYTIMLTSNGLVINGSPLSQSDQVFDQDDIHPILWSGIPNLVEGNTLGVQLVENLKIGFYLNGADLGIMTLKTEEELYGVIDLYGKAAEVSLCCQGSDAVVQEGDLFGKSLTSASNDDNQSELESSSNYQSLLYSEENNDFGRSFSLLQSESGLCDALKEADRSFLRLLSGNDELNRIISETNHQPLVFHHAHGRNVILTNDGRTAYRPSPYNEFKNALVMSSRPLETDEIFEICIDKMTDHWSGSLEMGVTLNNPVELNFPGTLSQLDKDCWILSGSCIMNNGITARNDYSLDMDTITVNSKIGLIRRRSGMLHFLLDGKDMGAAYFDVPPGIYVILDLYGQCSKVSITSKTGTSFNGDQNINSCVETTNTTSLLMREPETVMQSSDVYPTPLGPSRLSPFDRVMLVFKENVTSLTDDDNWNNKPRHLNVDNHEDRPELNDEDSSTHLFDGDNIFGDGIRWDQSLGFSADNQKRNCVIQSKYPLKTNIYYELVFQSSETKNQNSFPITFGFTTEKFSSPRYLVDDLLQLITPSLVFIGEKLFVDGRLHSLNYIPALSKFKKRCLIGIFLHGNNHLEIFANRIRVVILDQNHSELPYMFVDLKGWYDCVMPLDIPRKVIVDPTLLQHTTQRPLSGFSNKNEVTVDVPILQTEMKIISDNLSIEDPLMINILKELYELLPLFMVSLKGIETSRLIEKIVLSNNDIVLSIKRDIENGEINKLIQKHDIRSLLIEELAKRFSFLSDLKYLGSSHYEIARVLRRQVLVHDISYDANAKVFVVPRSCLSLEEARLNRSEYGYEFGLAIINQELKSEKYKAYEIHLAHQCPTTDLLTNSTNKNIAVGLILIETKHFRKADDAFKFLLSIPSPKHISSISNHINLQLGLFESESPSLVLTLEDDSVYLNGRRICQSVPFNISTLTTNHYISFKLRDSETSFNDIYLSIRTNDCSNNYLIFSQSLSNSCRNGTTIFSESGDYFYIPFIWLKNKVSISIMTGSNNITQTLLGSNQANRREWLEKHYNDELNKETCQISINDSSETSERQCFSLKRAAFVKTCLSLPETYFKNKSAICFCNSCRSPTMGSGNLSVENCEVLIKGDPAKEFRLPLGCVKYNIRLKRESRGCLSLWHLAYLTLSPLLIHKLLASPDPVSFLKHTDHSLSSVLSWLTITTTSDVSTVNKQSIILSPWQPLIGGYISEDRIIRPCIDSELNCYEPSLRTNVTARVALEVRVKPNTYQSTEYKIISENTSEENCIVVKDTEAGPMKKTTESNSSRSINPKTVWILNGDANSVVISGLLIKII